MTVFIISLCSALAEPPIPPKVVNPLFADAERKIKPVASNAGKCFSRGEGDVCLHACDREVLDDGKGKILDEFNRSLPESTNVKGGSYFQVFQFAIVDLFTRSQQEDLSQIQ